MKWLMSDFEKDIANESCRLLLCAKLQLVDACKWCRGQHRLFWLGTASQLAAVVFLPFMGEVPNWQKKLERRRCRCAISESVSCIYSPTIQYRKAA